MLSFNMCEGPKKIWHHFGLFLSLFSAFHLKFLQLCKKPPSYISGTHQLLFPLVNNGQNWCQKLCKIFSPLLILQGECVTNCQNNSPETTKIFNKSLHTLQSKTALSSLGLFWGEERPTGTWPPLASSTSTRSLKEAEPSWLEITSFITALCVTTSASKSSIQRFVITEKAPTRAFSWLKAATFTFKTLLRHY